MYNLNFIYNPDLTPDENDFVDKYISLISHVWDKYLTDRAEGRGSMNYRDQALKAYRDRLDAIRAKEAAVHAKRVVYNDAKPDRALLIAAYQEALEKNWKVCNSGKASKSR